MRFSRFTALIGSMTYQNISNKTVLVAGIGGVGSFALEGLARSGIGTIVIVDNDIVDETNSNRQLLALHSTIGLRKVDVAKKRLLDINPDIKVISKAVFIDETTIDSVFDLPIDFIVDAVDYVNAKLSLLKKANQLQIPIIAAMGFGNKLHPEMIKISLLSETSICPLAKTMRQKVKAAGLSLDTPVVYSQESPLLPTDTAVKIGSSSTVPSTAGLLMASYVINSFITQTKGEQI
ncbi:MAG: tRNA threonylcarbamoyladenosine dehydratase [Candidatus Izemoplasmatales bacterium]|nr:tRNA threonylcarbamoyladenosine dehydratase [Candidatus Izemoplasmatales bacterium]MDD3864912.1 tRNA threonylcarbamoyladenosine dehydratase [Candidatus Izemoplasmatales bacterium]